ncbi:carboxypeptidase-like regulatory domain-containing protein [Sabulilitoribacter multivorans]|uniref:Carboxypeptidase-like regulatory domain-containing protein n=1 Tax=Flaviramulus multivorans TaxID=1304750 RepID=A0ABS9IIG5_9FLAO|nr:carboxypeptidase-like regulatory domain-containing protein [Flaviramulus multivorans]MCF7560547.1 carboxypeptidase-like regulatory domain-containing protein [Flaviramulus multivorans]
MMLKSKYLITLIGLISFWNINSQTIEISGKVESKTDVENIHVINTTAKFFTVTNKSGDFNITAKLNDTIVFSSIQHKPKEVIISKQIISTKVIYVYLEELINELDEVLVGKILTGDLLSDINNTEGDPPINFYDVGIPGYKGKPATQSERRLAEAGIFKPQMLLGLLGGGIPLNPILNGISGRTKMLKNRVDVEEREALMQRIRIRLSKDFFYMYPLHEDLKMDFFYFCADDENFLKACKNKLDVEVLNFLKMKYSQYMENVNSTKN